MLQEKWVVHMLPDLLNVLESVVKNRKRVAIVFGKRKRNPQVNRDLTPWEKSTKQKQLKR